MTYRHTGDDGFDIFQRETNERLRSVEQNVAALGTVKGTIEMSVGTTETSLSVGPGITAVALGGNTPASAVSFRFHGDAIMASATVATTATFILL